MKVYRHFDLGICPHCKEPFTKPICTAFDPEAHNSRREGIMSSAIDRIQEDIMLVEFLRKCSVDYVYAKDGKESPFNEPTYNSN